MALKSAGANEEILLAEIIEDLADLARDCIHSIFGVVQSVKAGLPKLTSLEGHVEGFNDKKQKTSSMCFLPLVV